MDSRRVKLEVGRQRPAAIGFSQTISERGQSVRSVRHVGQRLGVDGERLQGISRRRHVLPARRIQEPESYSRRFIRFLAEIRDRHSAPPLAGDAQRFPSWQDSRLQPDGFPPREGRAKTTVGAKTIMRYQLI